MPQLSLSHLLPIQTHPEVHRLHKLINLLCAMLVLSHFCVCRDFVAFVGAIGCAQRRYVFSTLP